MDSFVVLAPTYIEKNAVYLLIAVFIFLALIHSHILLHIRMYKPDLFKRALYTPFLSLKYAYAEMDRTEAIVAIICTVVSLVLIVVLLFAHGRYLEFVDITSRS